MPKHIKVELDFIPIEERLPTEIRDYVCLRANSHSMTTGHRCIDECFYNGEGGWSYDEGETAMSEYWNVTHWAECPGKIAEVPDED